MQKYVADTTRVTRKVMMIDWTANTVNVINILNPEGHWHIAQMHQ